MTTKTTEDTNKAIATINSAFDDLLASRTRLLKKRDVLVERAQILKNVPLSLEEVKELVLLHVASVGSQYPGMAGLGDLVDSLQRPRGPRPSLAFGASVNTVNARHQGPCNALDYAAVKNPRVHTYTLGVLASDKYASFFSNPKVSLAGSDLARFEEARFCFFFPDQVAEKICTYLDKSFKPQHMPGGLTDSDKALSATDRMHEIEAIELKVDELDAEIRAVDEQLVALPVNRPERKDAACRLNIDINAV